ncbi:hypothetical protein Q765_05200 [Flavobacterium rivuli WB 3.3-2 = DSM 21788]|uniref:Uncharacterized protein n=1 Tax=Flavobacterium rivuli WB 3.3-2 = DSM 21788 TaxID=1121895 RepID=A0A0A2M4F6_9FLAO|nr:hypothetical protein Q765_05200 [Flavobacterium rivuli WB 3.3-2 = DSM 21788]
MPFTAIKVLVKSGRLNYENFIYKMLKFKSTYNQNTDIMKFTARKIELFYTIINLAFKKDTNRYIISSTCAIF